MWTIRENTIANKLIGSWYLSLVLITPVLSVDSYLAFVVIILLGMGWAITLIRIGMAQGSVIRFSNVRVALASGHIAIATNSNRLLCDIANGVSKYLDELGIVNYGTDDPFIKHIVAPTQDCFHQVPVDDVVLMTKGKSKLNLIIFADKCQTNGTVTDGTIISVGFCLYDNGGQRVILLGGATGKELPTVNICGKSPTQVAEEIVGEIFDSLNVTIRAATASTK